MLLFYQTPGYEDMELSTQIVIASALEQRIEVRVLDRRANLICLKKGRHREYIQEATKTSKDSWMTSILMVNKSVSKQILQENGLCVPKGKCYGALNKALMDYPLFLKKKCVVKPKTTDMGVGVVVLQKNTGKSAFKKALTNAFSYDKDVIVEEFMEGMEYRFLVINNKLIGVIRRIPANVTGDGKNSIETLIKIKNKSPLRAEWCRGPLEYIVLGKLEKEVLQNQGLSFRSLLPKGKTVFLRHNSNLATGGDSVDYTDEVHFSYKKIAIRAAQAFNAKICGVDIIIKNIKQASHQNGNYRIIEVNDNPGITMHNFPYHGKNRNVGKHVLELLGFIGRGDRT